MTRVRRPDGLVGRFRVLFVLFCLFDVRSHCNVFIKFVYDLSFFFFVFLSISFLLLCFNWRTLHTSLLISSFYLQVQEEMTQVGVVNFGPFLLFCCYTKITKKEKIKLHHKKTGPGLFHTRI